ncbi:hypothetical protein [Spirosoma sordidisoli]|uniref:Uncharacterized protein n=1 Tax=Spirosoma sordidisoli TaxID=2502893 RepID=A0A4Q2UGP1_9BACT|nr:hypothetical protein [Spirosoma sordidisoli]RYC66571.1 hypothetical protein EQG79_28670 [Spirosoma sordidisoli]
MRSSTNQMTSYFKNLLMVLLFFTTEWRCKGPARIDYESAAGTIIGREKCSTDNKLNAWLINLQPLGSASYGSRLVVNGKIYANVVKAYTLDSRYQDSTKTYIFDFYQRASLNQPACDQIGGSSDSVPQITILAVHNKG